MSKKKEIKKNTEAKELDSKKISTFKKKKKVKKNIT